MDPAFQRHRWTVDDLMRMVDAGVLHEDDPIELIDGELCVMSPQGPPHRMGTVRVRRALERAFGEGHYVQDHSAVLAGPNNLPEPDVAVVQGAERDDAHPGPAEVVLLVELSQTSQAEDRAKAAVYAAAGFREYWNLDLPARRLTVYRDPDRDQREYRLVAIYREPDAVPIPGTTIPIAALLPPE